MLSPIKDLETTPETYKTSHKPPQFKSNFKNLSFTLTNAEEHCSYTYIQASKLKTYLWIQFVRLIRCSGAMIEPFRCEHNEPENHHSWSQRKQPHCQDKTVMKLLMSPQEPPLLNPRLCTENPHFLR
jgi:hypothetical protein